MESLSGAFSGMLILFLLVLLNGLFVAAEFALVRSLGTRLKTPELRNKVGTSTAIRLLDSLDKSISTTQLGITSLGLILGWFSDRVLHDHFVALLTSTGFFYQGSFVEATATAMSFVLATFMLVVVGELCAKSIAIRHPETTLRTVAAPLYFISRLFRPFVIMLNGSANFFLRLFGIRADLSSERIHSTGELAMLISQSTEKGVLDKDEEEMLQGVFNFSETIAREVMTPRTDMVTIPRQATFAEVIKVIHKSGFSRFPVTDGTADNIVGILLSRDMLPVVERYVGPNAKPFSVTEIMRDPYFIPGTKSINDLLKEFKQRKLHMAIVLDEHGGVDGAITLEDIIEEIVGDIFDESDAVQTDIVVDTLSGDVIVDGGVLVDDINEQFELAIPEGEYDTIAGFVMSSLGRVPQPGDQIAINSSGVALMGPDGTGTTMPNGDGLPEAQDAMEGLIDPDFNKPKAIFIVERVTGNRVESVRLHQVKDLQTPADEGTLSQ